MNQSLEALDRLLRGPVRWRKAAPDPGTKRRHPSLGYQTPDQVYLTGQGVGARIIDNRDRPSASAPPLEDAAPR